MTAACAYSIAIGKLYCDIPELQAELSRLVGYSILTHEMANEEMWAKARKRLEREFYDDWFATHTPEPDKAEATPL